MDYITHMLSNPPENVHSAILTDADRPGRAISWQEYASIVKRIAVGLRAIGVAEQGGVALLSPNDIYYHILGDGAIAAGATFAGIPTFIKQNELVGYIAAAQVQWLFVAAEFLELALTAQISGFDKSRVIVFDPPGLEQYCGPQPCFSRILDANEKLWQNPFHGKDPKVLTAFRLFTSGTTGKIKAAEITHAASLARLHATDCNFSPQDVAALQVIGLYHVSGQNICNRACAGKLPAYISCADDAPTILDRIQACGATYAMLPPRTIEAITAAIHAGIRSREILQSLKNIVVGGSPSREEAVNAFAALLPSGAFLRTGFASTEAGLISVTPFGSAWIPGYVGSLTPGTEAKIINIETLEKLSPDTEGEICVRSAQLFKGYCNDQIATESAFLPDADGPWFRFGDSGFLDSSNGQLAVTGRLKETFKVRYEEVAPIEVEEQLLKHASIVDAAVTSTRARDNDKDCECMAYVVRNEASRITAQEVVDYIASKLSRHKAPTGGVVFCEGIPRGAMKKVLMRQLTECPALQGSAKYIDISMAGGE